MNVAAAPSFNDSAAAADAAVTRAIALWGVAARLTRTAFALAMQVKRRVATARSEGREPVVPGRSVTLSGVIAVVRMALLVADALRWRLRTPAVRLAMRLARPQGAPKVAKAPKPKYERKVRWPVGPDMSDPMAQLLERRRHPEAQQGIRQMIAALTDAGVVNMIGTYLLTATEMLGDVETTAEIKRLIRAAAKLFDGEEAELVVPRVCGAVAPEELAAETPVPEPEGAPAAAPDAAERGPPLA